MPTIASKYKNSSRTVMFDTQSPRDDSSIIKRSEGGNFYYGGNEQYVKPSVKGSVAMKTMTNRVNLHPDTKNISPTLYTQIEDY